MVSLDGNKLGISQNYVFWSLTDRASKMLNGMYKQARSVTLFLISLGEKKGKPKLELSPDPVLMRLYSLIICKHIRDVVL